MYPAIPVEVWAETGGRLLAREIHGLLGDTRVTGRYTGYWKIHGLLGDTRVTGRYTGYWEIHGLLGDTRGGRLEPIIVLNLLDLTWWTELL